MKVIKTKYQGKYQLVRIDNKFIYVMKCSSGMTVFADEIEFVKATKLHFVWKIKHTGEEFKTNEYGYGRGKSKDVFVRIQDEPLQFCNLEKGIKTNYIKGIIL